MAAMFADDANKAYNDEMDKVSIYDLSRTGIPYATIKLTSRILGASVF